MMIIFSLFEWWAIICPDKDKLVSQLAGCLGILIGVKGDQHCAAIWPKASNAQWSMCFTDKNGNACFQSFWKIRVDLHDEFALDAMRPTDFSYHHEIRLAWDRRACRLPGVND